MIVLYESLSGNVLDDLDSLPGDSTPGTIIPAGNGADGTMNTCSDLVDFRSVIHRT